MHLNRFDLNLLIALDALLQEKNVTRAAERVFVSQPAMSAALQKLRDYFNDPLLVRVGREMNLTPRGLSLVEPVREALLSIQATLGTQASFDPATVKRAFSVVVADFVIPRVMPRVLRRMVAEAPGVTCAVEEISQTSLSRLEYGDVDLCLFIHDPRLHGMDEYPDTLRTLELASVRWVCMVWREHPSVGETITAQQFLSLPHLIARPPGHKAPIADLTRHISSRQIDVRATAQRLVDLPFMIVGTPLIATLPEAVAKRFTTFMPVKIVEPPDVIKDGREVLVWHKRNEADPGHAWLRGLFAEAARQL
jgi:LysR family transcriptional regulator, nod-box dependent transcriptional activator